MHPALFVRIDEIETAATRALLVRQHDDGLWRDFQLKPGQSDTWCTGWTGWALAHARPTLQITQALQLAAQALISCARPDGWGYNSLTDPDADSTAWVVRFLSLVLPSYSRLALPALLRYLDASGEAHTLAQPSYGTWSHAHPDVTAVGGLALLDANAGHTVVEQTRQAVLARAASTWPPKCFWWATVSYSLAWSVAFLVRSGQLPVALHGPTLRWLEGHASTALTPFEHALDLMCLVHLGYARADLCTWHVCRLVQLFDTAGWRGSAPLLVPAQQPDVDVDSAGPVGPHTDSGVLTTSLALTALLRWARAAGAASR